MEDVGGETTHTEARDERWPLPEGWCWATLGEGVPKPDAKLQPDPDSDLPFIGMDHVEEAGFRLLGQGKFAEMKSAASHFRRGDILYGRLRPYLNKVHLARFEGAASAEFIVLRSSDGIRAEFLKYILHRQHFVNFAMERVSGDRPRTNYQSISEYPLPLPPAAEQARIAEKIDALFAQIEAGEAALAEARRNVACYRKAVLKAAITGALTADWRAENADTLENGEALRTRLLAERRAAWERDQIEKAKAKGKPLKGEAWKAKYKPPVEPETEGLPELPEGWIWASLEQVGEVRSGQTPTGVAQLTKARGDYPWFKVGSMTTPGNEVTMLQSEWWIDETDRLKLGMHIVPPGAIVFPKRGGAILTNKKRRIARRCLIDLNVMAYCPTESIRNYMWVYFQQLDLRTIYDGSNVPQINYGDVAELFIAVPPTEEQAEIVARVDAALEEANRLDAQLGAQEGASKALRQSVLKAAFEGRLVPQDPNEEPASKLLERIKAERTKAGKKPRKARA